MLDQASKRTGRVVETAAVRHVRAWLLLVSALALHVADEALTDFLGFYNPLVLKIRSQIPWFPMPTFTNGLGHLAGSAYFQRWLPGATSAPVLVAASVFLAHATWQRHRSGLGGIRHAV